MTGDVTKDTIKIISDNQNIFIGLITVIITIYIPVGILFLTRIKEESVYKLLDEHIISSKVFNIKWIIFYIITYFVILLSIGFLNENIIFIQIIGIISISIILFLLTKGIIGIYSRYNPKNKAIVRKKYLSNTKDYEIRKDIFSFNLKKHKDCELIMKSFFNIINKTKNRTIKSHLLETYLSYLNSDVYNKLFAEYGDFSSLSKLLDLYYISRSLDQIENDKKHSATNYGRESTIIRRILNKHLNNLDKGKEHLVISIIKKHIKSYLDIELYLKYFHSDILNIILNSKELIIKGEFLDFFAKELPIYEINIENYHSENKIEIFDNLFKRIIDKIQQNSTKNNYDSSVDSIIKNFFPRVDIICFSTLLTFYFAPYDPDNRIISYSKYKINFGYISRGHILAGPLNSNSFKGIEQDEENYTIKFIKKILNIKLEDTKEYIKSCKEILKNNNITKIENSKIKRLKYYLEKIIDN